MTRYSVEPAITRWVKSCCFRRKLSNPGLINLNIHQGYVIQNQSIYYHSTTDHACSVWGNDPVTSKE